MKYRISKLKMVCRRYAAYISFRLANSTKLTQLRGYNEEKKTVQLLQLDGSIN